MVIMPQENRRFPRLKVKVPLRCQIRGVCEYSNFITDNISLGGLGFVCDKFMVPATKVMLEVNILLHNLTPIAKIAWSAPVPHSDKYRAGAEFLEFDAEQKKYLEDFLQMQEIRA